MKTLKTILFINILIIIFSSGCDGRIKKGPDQIAAEKRQREWLKIFQEKNNNSFNDTSDMQQHLIIKGTKVNIRSLPEKSSAILFQLNNGDDCIVLIKGKLEIINNMSDYWYNISYNGKTGWVFGQFTSLQITK